MCLRKNIRGIFFHVFIIKSSKIFSFIFDLHYLGSVRPHDYCRMESVIITWLNFSKIVNVFETQKNSMYQRISL